MTRIAIFKTGKRAQAAARFMALERSPDLFDKLRFMKAEARRGPLSQALEQTYALGRRTG